MSGDSGLVTAAIANQSILWLLAVLFYGLGDTVTTVVGMQGEETAEAGPVALAVVEQAGIPGFMTLKIGFIGACLGIWYLVQTPGRVAIPFALAVVGAGVTGWNLWIILS